MDLRNTADAVFYDLCVGRNIFPLGQGLRRCNSSDDRDNTNDLVHRTDKYTGHRDPGPDGAREDRPLLGDRGRDSGSRPERDTYSGTQIDRSGNRNARRRVRGSCIPIHSLEG